MGMARETKQRLRIYVAGPYSCENRCQPLGVDLVFMRRGLETSVELLKRGYAPFCPWLDYLFQLVSNGNGLQRVDYYEYSIAWLLASDAMFVTELRKCSNGTKNEIMVAEKENIPIFWTINELEKWSNKLTEE